MTKAGTHKAGNWSTYLEELNLSEADKKEIAAEKEIIISAAESRQKQESSPRVAAASRE